MPRLPTAEDLGTRIARPTRGVVQIEPDKMGSAIAGVADHIGQIADEETKKLEELAAQDALNTLERKRLEMTYDPEKGFSNVTGSAVLNRPLLKEVPEAFDNEIKTLSANLKTKRAQQYFQQRAANVKNSITGDLFRHVALQTDKAHDDVESSTIETLVGAVTADPSRLDWALAGAGEVAAKRSTRKTITDPAMLAVLKQGTEGKVVTAALKRLLSGDTVDTKAATELIARHEAIIPADSLLIMKEAVRKADVSQTTGTYVRDLLGDTAITRADAGKRIEAEFGKDPDKLKAARVELAYQFEERDRVKRDNEERLLNPVNTLLGDALNAGRPIGKAERDRVLTSLRTESPEIYAKAAGAIDQHNDEIRAERRATESHLRTMAESSPSARVLAMQIKYDILTNPSKYRGKDSGQMILDYVSKGKLRAGDGEELLTLQAKLTNPASREEFVTLVSGNERLMARLRGSTINGKRFDELDKGQQAEITTTALEYAEKLLTGLQQARGAKASKQDVNDIVDSLFTTKTYRDTIFGAGYGDRRTPHSALDMEGSMDRTAAKIPAAVRTKIEQWLRDKKQPLTPDNIVEAYNLNVGR